MATLRGRSARPVGALVQRAAEPIAVLDAAGRIVFGNAAWWALTGAPAGSDSDPDAEDDATASDTRALTPPPEARAGRPAGAVTSLPGRDGSRRTARVEFWPLHDAPGRPLGFFVVARPPESTPHAPEAPSLRLHGELAALRAELTAAQRPAAPLGRGPAHARLLEQIEAAAALRLPALVAGEPGTGKRLVARAIHEQAGGRGAPVVLDAAALSAAALATALDAVLEDASRGGPARPTVVVRELTALPRDFQQRLAALGPEPPARLLATTSVDPEAALRGDRLRPDLFYRMTALVVRLAPLRDRLDDLPLLAQAFLEEAEPAGGTGRPRPVGFEPTALDALGRYDWPGNLAELRRVVEAAASRARGDLVALDDLPAGVRGHLGAAYPPPPSPPPVTTLDATLEMVERRLIERALHASRQNKSRAAELLLISRPRLYRRMKDLGIADLPEGDDAPTPGRPCEAAEPA